MNATEEARSPEEVAELDRVSRERLIEGEVLAVLGKSGCRYPELFKLHLIPSLATIAPGMGDPVRVLAVDASGDVRQGPTGPMGVEDLLAELRPDPTHDDIGWGHH